MEDCQGIERTFAVSSPSRQGALRRGWAMRHCDEYTNGQQLRANRTHATVFDIGFHSGDDTLP